MSPELVDKILQSSKINDTTQGTNNEQGHGIGLFISQYFIKKYPANNWKIKIKEVK